jgi:hypothetical protein
MDFKPFYKDDNGKYYWNYIDVYVPIEIRSIPSLDGVNTLFILINEEGTEYSIGSTCVGGGRGYTYEEYHKKFCNYDEETKRWIYVGRDNNYCIRN